jgi:uncharacterized protein
MRRKSKEIINFDEIEQILKECKVCRIAVCKERQPYVFPINYGYENKSIYIHTGLIGLKMQYLMSNPRVCVEIERNTKVIENETACQFSAAYESVIAFGIAERIQNVDEKTKALDILMKQLSGKDGWTYSKKRVDKIEVIRIDLEEITGKRSNLSNI